MANITKTMVVIPTYNEKENLEHLVRSILILHPDFFITIVDDNSPDGTGELADKLVGFSSMVHVIHRLEKGGLGSAYVQGFRYALSPGTE